MGLRQPATKIWEIPEPKPAYAPARPEPKPERVQEPPLKLPEREKEPALRP